MHQKKKDKKVESIRTTKEVKNASKSLKYTLIQCIKIAKINCTNQRNLAHNHCKEHTPYVDRKILVFLFSLTHIVVIWIKGACNSSLICIMAQCYTKQLINEVIE